ncbi:LEAF RUST 10 DISEASE-RESISTANCE LOCUS RECEPTOR-LIKE PROTEIN KINASE-like 1.1 isoform X2 [Trifolium pratense]|uniref:LEAF RUST 10 DISEASE-RESISTANCE LOCUS RECEPTOR-LIKE PROTEIN KINASE-like 1.1 isoform X2 n=1 Tax=Trifolium pratense TaxID=57577 RepID=UPI001E6915CD|nr:LEAF RUST 10 DISEASE-RESISTANCE LOCUS RECEPTOR-LIKE PROTEIN KINASE-like 1.1 isoform X2 [Trifolium pratense]
MALQFKMTPLFIFKSLIFFQFLLVSGQDGICPTSFSCGYLGNITFPFTIKQHPHCGLLTISGCDNKNISAPKTIQLGKTPSKQFISVISVDGDIISVSDEAQRKNLLSKKCQAFRNYTLPPKSLLGSFYIKYNITMFKCNHSLSVTPPKLFVKYTNTNCSGYNIYYDPQNADIPPGFKVPSSLAKCTMFQVAIRDIPTSHPFDFLSSDIAIEVQLSDDCNKCFRHRGGRCQLDIHGKFLCAQEDKRLARKLGLGIGLLVVIIITGLLIIWRCKRRVPEFYSKKYTESDSVYHGVPVFSFKDLEVATKKFDSSRELGEGGFGTVYYGKLKDGREVAVKRLYQHNFKRVEQFMNEIKILTRLRHRNLVSLYGCTSHQSHELLLVYEYISNGTVASHLRRESGFLPWHIRMKVALETATALAYLHASEIIHRDVKTNNILLDNTFCIKVADFGLSKLFPNDVTHVSTAPQGTPGYMDPEYHQCYRLTSKSDVYSFGVVLVELISSMPAVDMTRDKDEINLANLAVRKIQKSAIHELVDPSLGFESDNDVKKKIVSIAELAFQCLQRDKELRPSMDEVLEVIRRIDSGSGRDEFGHVEEVIDSGARISCIDVRSLSPSSPDHIEVKLLKNKKLTPSPKSVSEKWDSESTTSNASGQSASRM